MSDTTASTPGTTRGPVRRRIDCRARGHLGSLAILLGVAGVVVACGGSSYSAPGGTSQTASSGESSASTGPAEERSASSTAMGPPPAATALVTAVQTSIGTVLAGPSGKTVYVLLGANGADLPCTGTCATFWPPVVLGPGVAPTPAPGVTARLGTVTRSDGSIQLTVGGHPVYFFARDSAPGQVNGQGISSFGGTWHAVLSNGQPVGMGSSGYGY